MFIRLNYNLVFQKRYYIYIKEKETSTMPRKIYTQEEKLSILARAAAIGVSKAAKEHGVPYATVAKWRKENDVFKSDEAATSDTPALIEACEEEIVALNESLKAKKNELKALLKQKAKEDRAEEKRKEAAARAEAERKAAEDKEKLLQALSESGKSVDELLAFLNS
jgi:transposase-like protein